MFPFPSAPAIVERRIEPFEFDPGGRRRKEPPGETTISLADVRCEQHWAVYLSINIAGRAESIHYL